MKNHYHTLIIGSGCAGFNAADWLHDLGVRDIALITEGINMGTSRNTGSDKQTYYKLTLAGDEPDSVYEMASTLFSGGSVHGDTALIEAACSVKSFMKLVNLGLPFPTNRFGAFVGYKTDHDPRQRATSCGPLTSKLMTEALEKSVKGKGIEIIDNGLAVKLLCESGEIRGLALLDLAAGGYRVLGCRNVILATGGPAGIYEDVVFPESQSGGSGLALDAGAAACNLSEWQYGLASIDFRWNVSGTYQQVLPRYISVGADGAEREFLPDYFDVFDKEQALNMVFLKGYQWPFDVKKLAGSSRVDTAVAAENAKGRAVYMDFRSNPAGLDFEKLSEECFGYLERSDALFGTPIERLAKMNPKAVELYRSNGIDLYAEPLKVAVCAQHCNGGIAVDANWESSVRGLYVVGEAAGTFGVYRPGGSALNAAQVGAMRAAEHIAAVGTESRGDLRLPGFSPPKVVYGAPSEFYGEVKKRMSRHAAYIRDVDEMMKLLVELKERKARFFEEAAVDLVSLHKRYDALVTQIAVLSAMVFSAEEIGSRGSALMGGAASDFDFEFDKHVDKVVTTRGDESYFEDVRPLPDCDDWFETVWNESSSTSI